MARAPRTPKVKTSRSEFVTDEAPAAVADQTINKIYARLFNTDDGRKVLTHLATVTTGQIVPLASGPDALQRQEGKRELAADIFARVNKGMNNA